MGHDPQKLVRMKRWAKVLYWVGLAMAFGTLVFFGLDKLGGPWGWVLFPWKLVQQAVAGFGLLDRFLLPACLPGGILLMIGGAVQLGKAEQKMDAATETDEE